jgi:serine/threonine protein kinase
MDMDFSIVLSIQTNQSSKRTLIKNTSGHDIGNESGTIATPLSRRGRSSDRVIVNTDMKKFKSSYSRIQESKLRRTHSLVGHPNYWAPEYANPDGYGLLVDLWSLGICMFEMATGYFPFGHDKDDTYTLMQKIKNDPLEFPESFVKSPGTATFIDFVSQLLSKVPEERPGPDWNGHRGDYNDLRQHPYLEPFDF